MATKQKMSDLGWMYYAPPKPKADPTPVEYGLMSQIPGLNELPAEPEDEAQRGWIKESDSPYIRLAKQGGRQNLLQFREPKPQSTEAKPYPRCEWFYQEDNALEDQENEPEESKNSKYEFMLPDYMVHDSYKGNSNDNESHTSEYKPERLPYGGDKQTVYEREGEDVTDKRIRIPELKKPGFGVRNEKLKDKPVKNVTISQSAKSSAGRKKCVEPAGEDRTTMARIIAGTYEQMWYDKLQEKVDSEHVRNHKPKRKDGKQTKQNKAGEPGSKTEYQTMFSVATKDANRPKYGRRAQQNDGGDGVNIKQEMAKIEKDVEQMFKLSKFKNVPAKVDTNIEVRS